MTINIEKMRADMRWENRKFVLQAIVAAAALLGAGVAVGNLLLPRITTSSQPIVLQLPPGTTITTPDDQTSPPTTHHNAQVR